MLHRREAIKVGHSYCLTITGNCCGDAFIDDACYQFYLLRMLNSLHIFKLQLHAYLLLPNTIYLLLSPECQYGLTGLLDHCNKSYTGYFRSRFQRDSSPLSKQYTLSLVQGHELSLDCQKFVERRVLDLGVREHAGAYRWSSYCINSFGARSRYLMPLPAQTSFLKEGPDPYRRYRDFVAEPFPRGYLDYLNHRIESSQPISKRSIELPSKFVARRQTVQWQSENLMI